jgi:predicted HTH domain antitoxin
MKKRGRPQKPENSVKKRILQVRLLQEEKDAFEDAAKLAGLSCASWMRTRLREIARKELEAAQKKVKFL